MEEKTWWINLKKTISDSWGKLKWIEKIFLFIILLVNLIIFVGNNKDLNFSNYFSSIFIAGSIEQRFTVLLGTFVISTIFIAAPELLAKILRRPVKRSIVALIFIPLCILAFLQMIPWEAWTTIYSELK